MVYDQARNLIKDLGALAQTIKNIDEKRKLLDLQTEMNGILADSVEKDRSLLERDRRIKELEEQLEWKGELAFREGVYFSESDKVPYCPRCWEVDKRAVHLKVLGNGYMVCPQCEKGWNDPAMPTGGWID